MVPATVWRWGLAVVGLGILVIVVLSPQTGWIARQQLSVTNASLAAFRALAVLGVKELPGNYKPPDGEVSHDPDLYRAAAQRLQHDPGVAIAYALRTSPWSGETDRTAEEMTPRVAGLRPLLARFPTNPAVPATILRFSLQAPILNGREEQDLLSGRPVPRYPALNRPPTLRQLKWFDEVCATGERLDPTNGLFPFCRAIGQLERRQDAAAVVSIRRAAACRDWADYCLTEMYGQWRLSEEATGDRGAVPRTAMSGAILFPHYARFRTVARILTAKAMQAEQEGSAWDGVAFRHSLMVVGARMRAKSENAIGALVGIAIGAVASSRPGGQPLPDSGTEVGPTTEENRKARGEVRRLAYISFLRSHGMMAEARWYEALCEENEAAQEIVRLGAAPSEWIAPLVGITLAQTTSLSAVITLLWVLVAGALGGLAARLPAVREGRPMSGLEIAGAIVGVITALLVTAGCAAGAVPEAAAAGAYGVAIVVLLALRNRGGWACSLAGHAAGPGLGLLAVVAVGRPAIVAMLALAGVLQGLNGSPAPAQPLAAVPAMPYWIALLMLVPFTSLLLAIGAPIRRLPISVAMARGWASSAVPLAFVLVLTYAVAVNSQARLETRYSRELVARTRSENRYYAAKLHREWPVTIGGRS